jgi:D-3-phosphoglycerate dehydrogenase
MMILVLAKNLLENNKAFLAGDFDIRHRIVNMELTNKTLGIVGFGRIGKAVAKKAYYGFGMRVIVSDPHFKNSDEFDFVTRSLELEEVFSQSDFITLHLPVTKDTKGMVDHRLIEKMKQTAYLINAARFELLNERDFINALHEGIFAGAAIDVFNQDPPAIDSPMLNLPNVVYTPHNAAHTDEAFTKMALDAALGIHEVLSGIRPTWPVNL